MVKPDQEAIDTFISITGLSEAAAIRKLEEHSGNLNEAVNAHFIEGDRSTNHEASIAAPPDNDMDIDDPIPFGRDLNRFSALDPNATGSTFDGGPDIASGPPFVSGPRREVREIPVEVKDGLGVSSGYAPTIEDVTESAHGQGPEIRDTVIIDDDDDENTQNAPVTRTGPSAPSIVDVPDDIEEEMIRAAIEASKQDVAMSSQQYDDHLDLTSPTSRPRQSQVEDTDVAHAVSLSLQTAQREKNSKEGKVEATETGDLKPAALEEMSSSNGRRQSELEVGSSSIQEETEDVEEELPLLRHRRRRVTSDSINTREEEKVEDIEEVEVIPPSSPQQHDNVHAGNDFPSDEWGGISSVEHDEAVMLEAALFGGIPEESGYRFPHYAPHQFMQNDFDRNVVGPSPWGIPRPPSPSLTAQRLIREQQDDEYLAALQADREKELKAKEEAEAALEEARLKEEELREIERQLAAKDASLPQEPASDDENAVNLLVRMPDGSRRGRRFSKSDKLQFLFDFIDIGRGVKPGSYRLVRPYPRRAFSDGENTSTLNELGLTSKQEALYLELI